MRKNTLFYSFFAFVVFLLFYSCHKEPTDYRDKCLGTYYCTGTSRGKSIVDTLNVVKITYNDDQIKITGKYINTRVYIFHKHDGIQNFELYDQQEDRLRNYQGWFTDSTIHVYIYPRFELGGSVPNFGETKLDGVKAKKNFRDVS